MQKSTPNKCRVMVVSKASFTITPPLNDTCRGVINLIRLVPNISEHFVMNLRGAYNDEGNGTFI